MTAHKAAAVASSNATPPTFLPPRPLRRALPEITLIPAAEIEANPEVQVSVHVDVNGRVTEAHLIPGTGIPETLAKSALRAAKQWTFEPAKLDGQIVESNHTIIFEFDDSKH